MATLGAPEWNTVVETFAVGGFPWISQFKTLKIHYDVPALDCSGVYNFFASLFALAIYAYCTYAPPARLINWPDWSFDIAAAAVLTVVYFTLFFYLRQRVHDGTQRWPVIVNFCLYILIFASLTTGFSLLKLQSGNVLIEGTVVKASTSTGVESVYVLFNDGQGDYAQNTHTDSRGRFSVYIARDQASRIKRISFFKEGYATYTISLSGGLQLNPRYDNVPLRIQS